MSAAALRAQWLGRYAVYRERYEAALEKYEMCAYGAGAPRWDGMPHTGQAGDKLGAYIERRDAATKALRTAFAAMLAAKEKRLAAMDELPAPQKAVLQSIYLNGLSRKETGKRLGRSDFWVRQAERQGLAGLAMPTDWCEDLT